MRKRTRAGAQDAHLVRMGTLFDRYKNRLRAPEGSVILMFKEVVHDLYNIDIPKKYLRYSPDTHTLTVLGSGVLRQELQLRQEEILSHLQGRLGDKNIPKIIL